MAVQQDRFIPPSQKAENRAKDEEARKAVADQYQKSLKTALRVVGSTPDGLFVLKHLYSECQGNKPILGAIHGIIDEKATLYQAMRLNLWLNLRKLLNFDILKEIEYDADQIS